MSKKHRNKKGRNNNATPSKRKTILTGSKQSLSKIRHPLNIKPVLNKSQYAMKIISQINKVPLIDPPQGYKKKILLVNEASPLATGFSTYGKQLLTRLYQSGKYQVAQYGSYMASNDPRAAKLPWKFYGAYPDLVPTLDGKTPLDPDVANRLSQQGKEIRGMANPQQEQVFKSNNLNQFGLWRFDSVLLDFKPDVVCNKYDAPILTLDGYKPICKIQQGQFVKTHRGRYRKVAKTMKRYYNGKQRRIFLNGCSQPLVLTEQHPVLIYKYKKQRYNAKNIDATYDNQQPTWIAAKNVRQGDLVILHTAINEDESFTSNYIFDLSAHINNCKISKDGSFLSTNGDDLKGIKVKRYIELNSDFAKFLGAFVTDGCVGSNGRVSVKFELYQQKFAQEVGNIINDSFGVQPKINNGHIVFCSVIVAQFLRDIFCIDYSPITSRIDYNYKYHIPKYIWQSSKDVKQNFIAGIIMGDGCVKQRQMVITSCNKYLAMSYRNLLYDVGVPATIKSEKNETSSCGKVYNVAFTKQYRNKFVKLSGKGQVFTYQQPTRDLSVIKFINNRHFVSSVHQSRAYDYQGFVYNLQVEQDNSYTQVSIVHNCDMRDRWMCVANNTPIYTNNGIKQIQDISINDKVLTHMGRYKNVQNVFKNPVDKDIYKIKLKNYRDAISITQDHPILAISRRDAHWPNLSKEKPQWKQAHALKKSDIVLRPISKGYQQYNITKQQARLIGYYIAQGCVMYQGKKQLGNVKGLQFVFGNSDIELKYVDDVVNLLKQNYGITASIYNLDNQNIYKTPHNTTVIRVFNSCFGEQFIKAVGAHTAKSKLVPQYIYNNKDNQVIQHFLCGLLRGDGHQGHMRYNYCTVSKQLAYQVAHLLTRFNVVPSWGYSKNNIGEKIYYRWLFDIKDPVSVHNTSIIYNLYDIGAIKQHKMIYDNNLYLPIQSIGIDVDYNDQYVYNLQVEDDNSYVSQFIVHNCEWQQRSKYRKNFVMIWMPTVDGYPQKWQWIESYQRVDHILTYSKWGGQVLKIQDIGGQINYHGAASPGADTQTFRPMDKAQIKKKFGLDPRIKIVGTVMRNQKRKLFLRLLDSWRMVYQKNPLLFTNSFLHLHTSLTDVGFDIVGYLLRTGLVNSTTFTYLCYNCQQIFMQHWAEQVTCSNCNAKSVWNWGRNPPGFDGPVQMPNTNIGITREQLAEIYNIFDVYVQASIAQGWGMGINEAKACGVPILAVDWSAMSEQTTHGGYPIKVQTTYTESQTSQDRAIFDRQDLAKKILHVLKMDAYKYKMLSKQARQDVLDNYTYDKVAQKWMSVIDEIKIHDRAIGWGSPPKFVGLKYPNYCDLPQLIDDKDYILFLYQNIIEQPVQNEAEHKGFQDWVESVVNGRDRRSIFNYFKMTASQYNNGEMARTGITPKFAESDLQNCVDGILI